MAEVFIHDTYFDVEMSLLWAYLIVNLFGVLAAWLSFRRNAEQTRKLARLCIGLMVSGVLGAAIFSSLSFHVLWVAGLFWLAAFTQFFVAAVIFMRSQKRLVSGFHICSAISVQFMLLFGFITAMLAPSAVGDYLGEEAQTRFLLFHCMAVPLLIGLSCVGCWMELSPTMVVRRSPLARGEHDNPYRAPTEQ